MICVGNTARGDDGVAHEVARLVGVEEPSLSMITATSLDVSHAPDAARAERVLVVDACRRTHPLVMVEKVCAAADRPGSHGLSPQGLAAVVRDLYAASPEFLLVSVAAPSMEHHEGLSDVARDAARVAADEVRRLALEGATG